MSKIWYILAAVVLMDLTAAVLLGRTLEPSVAGLLTVRFALAAILVGLAAAILMRVRYARHGHLVAAAILFSYSTAVVARGSTAWLVASTIWGFVLVALMLTPPVREWVRPRRPSSI